MWASGTGFASTSGYSGGMLAHEIRARVARGEISPLEVAQAYLKRVQELDPGLGAFLSLNERLLEEAEAVDPGLPLAGLVVAVKDNIATRGLRTTAGSRLLENFVPPKAPRPGRRRGGRGAGRATWGPGGRPPPAWRRWPPG